MRRLLIALSLFSVLATSAVAEEDSTIHGVISSQIEAFQSDDFDSAFSFASPLIKNMFGTSENFGAMVRGGYPMIWRPADVTFVDQIQTDNMVKQRLRVLDQSGAEHWFVYEMIQIDGEWRINGVFQVEAPDVGV